MVKAKDVMRRRVFTVRPDATLRDAARLFVEKNVTGAPVVDARRRVVGVISQRDLVRRADEQERGRVPAFYKEGERLAIVNPVSTGLALVKEAMTPVVLSVKPDAPISKVAGLMTAKRVHRVMVVEGGKLAGIISSLDVISAARKVWASSNGPSRRRAPR